MDTGTLDELHYAGDKDISSVANSIDLNLFTLNVFINKNGFVFIDFNGSFKIVAKLFFVGNYLHGTAAENEGRTNENGIADFSCGGYTCSDTGDSLSFGLRNSEFGEDFLKRITVFGTLNGITIGSDDFDPSLHKRFCKIYSSLSAERSNNALGFFELDDVHNIFGSEGLEIEFIGGGVVG